MKKSLDQKILDNLLAQLNMCKGKLSALKASNLPTSRISERMEILESMIAVQKSKIEEAHK